MNAMQSSLNTPAHPEPLLDFVALSGENWYTHTLVLDVLLPTLRKLSRVYRARPFLGTCLVSLTTTEIIHSSWFGVGEKATLPVETTELFDEETYGILR